MSLFSKYTRKISSVRMLGVTAGKDPAYSTLHTVYNFLVRYDDGSIEREEIASNDRRNKKYLDQLLRLSQREERRIPDYIEDAVSDDYMMYLDLYAVIKRMQGKKEYHDRGMISDSKYIADIDELLDSALEED